MISIFHSKENNSRLHDNRNEAYPERNNNVTEKGG